MNSLRHISKKYTERSDSNNNMEKTTNHINRPRQSDVSDAHSLISKSVSAFSEFSQYNKLSRSKSPSKKGTGSTIIPSPSKSELLQLSEMKIIERPLIDKRGMIKRLGLNLRPKCLFLNHEQNELSLICIHPNCSSQSRLGCEKCVEDVHAGHEMIGVEQFNRIVENSYNQLQQKSVEFYNQCKMIEQPMFIGRIFKELSQMREYIHKQIEKVKSEILSEYIHKSGIDIATMRKELKRQEEVITSAEEILRKNIFDLSSTQIEMSIQMQQSNYLLQPFENEVKRVQSQFSRIEKQFSFAYNSFKESIMFDISTSFKDISIPILTEDGISKPSSNQKVVKSHENKNSLAKIKQNAKNLSSQASLKDQRIRLLIAELEKDLKDKKEVQKKLQDYLKQPSQANSKELEPFPYFTYFEVACEHVSNPKSNSVPIFSCCEQAYRCLKCHNKFNDHPAVISSTKHSKRYCIKCFSVFTVSHDENSPVICLECKDLIPA